MSFVHSIKFRFTVWYLAILGILLVSLGVGVYFYLSNNLHNNLDDTLKLRAAQLRDVRGVFVSLSQGEFQEKLGETVLLYISRGDELRRMSARNVDTSLVGDLDDLAVAALKGQKSLSTISTADGEELRVYAGPLSPEGPGFMSGRPGMMGRMPDVESAALVVGRSTGEIDEALADLERTLLIAVPLTLVVAGAGGVFLAGRALKPVDQIARTALEIEGRDLSQRIPVTTKDELGRLASTLNQMIERLEKAFKRQQQFTGDASHELRTPLAVIEAESTLALGKQRSADEYRQSLETVSQEAKHMSGIIDRLLTLARADSGSERLMFEEVDLRGLLTDLRSEVDVLVRDKGLELQLNRVDSVTVMGDRGRLRQLLLNLLDNAIRYTPAGGTISLSAGTEDQMAVIAISDTGIGIPEDALPSIFERFYRVDKARSRADGGSGLGLAICKHIAEDHGGRMEVESRVGKGSTFRVLLPLQGEPSPRATLG